MTRAWEATPEREVRGSRGRPLLGDDGRGKDGEPGDVGERDQDVGMEMTIILLR